MRRQIIIPLLVVALGCGFVADAADVAIAPLVGPSIIFDRDFSGAKTKSKIGFGIGFDAFYRLGCRSCRNFSLMMNGGYTSSGTFQFDSVKRKATGQIGIFKESLETFNWNIGADWSPRPVGKLKFHLFAAPGIYYTRFKNVSYKDGNNNNLPLPNRSNNRFDFGVTAGGGVEFMLSKRTSVGITPRIHMSLKDFAGRSSFQIPVSFKFYF